MRHVLPLFIISLIYLVLDKRRLSIIEVEYIIMQSESERTSEILKFLIFRLQKAA